MWRVRPCRIASVVERSPDWFVILKIGLVLRLYLWVVFDLDRNLSIAVWAKVRWFCKH